jgi:hypothetical protein
MPATSKRISRGAGPSGVTGTTEGRDHQHRVPHPHAEGHRKLGAHQDAGVAAFGVAGCSRRVVGQRQGLDRTHQQVFLEGGDVGDRTRIDPAQLHAEDATLEAAHHALGLEKRRRPGDPLATANRFHHIFVVRKGSGDVVRAEVRPVPEDLVAPGLLESVHHRQYDDDQPHPGRNARNADRSNCRDEDLATLRHQVAGRNEPLEAVPEIEDAGGGQRDEPDEDGSQQSPQQTRGHEGDRLRLPESEECASEKAEKQRTRKPFPHGAPRVCHRRVEEPRRTDAHDGRERTRSAAQQPARAKAQHCDRAGRERL